MMTMTTTRMMIEANPGDAQCIAESKSTERRENSKDAKADAATPANPAHRYWLAR
jgi:hypothetical protein